MLSQSNEFSEFIFPLARGQKGRRDLTFDEAKRAMELILSGDVEPEQLGAFLMLLRVKEETAEEMAGLASACLSDFQALPEVDFVIPSYAGKRRTPPWYIWAIDILASNGYSVLMHGGPEHTANRLYSEAVWKDMDWPMAADINDATAHIRSDAKRCYVDLACINPSLHQLLHLKPLFKLRSVANSFVRCLTPLKARVLAQSIFHPGYQPVHAQAAALMGIQRSVTIKGDGGEFEVNPERSQIALLQLKDKVIEFNIPRVRTLGQVKVPLEEWSTLKVKPSSIDHPGLEAAMATANTLLCAYDESTDWDTHWLATVKLTEQWLSQ